MRNFITGFILLSCSFAIFVMIYFFNPLEPTTDLDLEIYTLEDIIYVQGLTVTFESSDEVLKFDSPEQLKEYISDLTAEHNK